MAEKQIQKLMGILVEHQDLFNPLAGDNAQWIIQNPKQGIALMVNAIQGREKEAVVKILEPVSTIVIPATIERFVVKDNFLVNTGKKAKVKISYLSDNFKEWFLDKVEEPTGKITLCSSKLLVLSVDSPIISELGGEEKVETKLVHVFHLLSKQPNGEAGLLLTNGYVNIFYIRNKNGTLCAVFAFWDGVGWFLRAYSVVDPDRWDDGGYIFSPQFLLET